MGIQSGIGTGYRENIAILADYYVAID